MNEEKLRVLVSFTIYSQTIAPDEITEKLQIQPDNTAVKGTPRRSDSPSNIYRFHLWGLTTEDKIDSNRPVHEHIDYLLDMLHPHAEYLSQLSKHSDVRFLCTISNDNHS